MGIENLIITEDEGITEIETVLNTAKKLRLTFPKSYIAFISKHNAAILDNKHYPFFDNAYNEYTEYGAIDGFYGFGNHLPNYEQIEWAQDFDVYGYDYVIAFGYTANGDYICFDYRHNPETDEPHIVYMDHEVFDKKTNKMVISHIADSFDEFCDLLYEADD